MINLFGSVIPIIMFLVYASTQISNLATSGEVANMITFHLEAGMHPAGEQAVEELEVKSTCRWLDDKIDRLDDLIWELKHEQADANRIHDKEQDLDKYRAQFNTKKCANISY